MRPCNKIFFMGLNIDLFDSVVITVLGVDGTPDCMYIHTAVYR